ncbi:hypothetical protein V6N13_009447 [Hibiscus sabdariffa]
MLNVGISCNPCMGSSLELLPNERPGSPRLGIETLEKPPSNGFLGCPCSAATLELPPIESPSNLYTKDKSASLSPSPMPTSTSVSSLSYYTIAGLWGDSCKGTYTSEGQPTE